MVVAVAVAAAVVAGAGHPEKLPIMYFRRDRRRVGRRSLGAPAPRPAGRRGRHGWISRDGQTVIAVGFVRDGDLGQWRHVPDPATLQALGFYWCNVTAADVGFFERITEGPPYPASDVPARDDYPVCQP